MATNLTVRVNPQDHDDFVVRLSLRGSTSVPLLCWRRFQLRRETDHLWLLDDETADWVEIQVPLPVSS